MKFYIFQEGSTKSFEESEIIRFWKEGTLKGTDFVRTEKSREWTPLAELLTLSSSNTVPPQSDESHSEKEKRSTAKGTSQVTKDEGYFGKVLGLSGKLSKPEITKRYKELIAKYHPDKVQHLGAEFQLMAEQRAKQINEAYEFFRNNTLYIDFRPLALLVKFRKTAG